MRSALVIIPASGCRRSADGDGGGDFQILGDAAPNKDHMAIVSAEERLSGITFNMV
jgi:hypothetical protein